MLGQALAELAVLDERLSTEDRSRFGNLAVAHVEKTIRNIRALVDEMIKERSYVTCFREGLESRRLGRAGTELFGKIYHRPLPFPFDGFSTARGNAADTCQQLTSELLAGSLDFNSLIARPPKVKNRGVKVLHESWGVFTQTGAVSRRPEHAIVQEVVERWDAALNGETGRLALGRALRNLCLPPHGANLASAGLLLGLYVAPRSNDLGVVVDGQQLSVPQWLQHGVFRGKFLNLARLESMEFVALGESSGAWEALLDEWEQAESHIARCSCLKRAQELAPRVPIPPACSFRLVHLREQSSASTEAIRKQEDKQEGAYKKIERGYERGDVSNLSWGAAELLRLKQGMTEEIPLWTQAQIEELEPQIARATQMIVQVFHGWLVRQRPSNDSPDTVGDFKHRMLRLTGANLQELGLTAEWEALESHTTRLVSRAETVAEAGQLLRDVRSWLGQHADALRIVRVAEVRGLRDVGKSFSAKLKGMSQRIEMAEISELRTQLADFLAKLRDAESKLVDRATRIWKSKLRTEEELDTLLAEVEYLTGVFEGCERDVEDLSVIRRALRAYRHYHDQLQRPNLTWQELESLAQALRREAEATFGTEEALPWPVAETFKNFTDSISKQRSKASLAWINSIEAAAADVASMPASDANRLHAKVANPPAVLADQHAARLAKVASRVQERLESLAFDWLIERFRELPEASKRRFLQLASQIIGE